MPDTLNPKKTLTHPISLLISEFSRVVSLFYIDLMKSVSDKYDVLNKTLKNDI
jgi:hypothetical protein